MWYQLSFLGWRILNIFIAVGIISPVVKLTVVLVTCTLCIYLVLVCIWDVEYFHLPTTNYNTKRKNLLANRKMCNFPNDFLQDSFLLGLAVIWIIVFRYKIPSCFVLSFLRRLFHVTWWNVCNPSKLI